MNPHAVPHLFQEELYFFGNPLVVVLAKPWERYTTEEQALLQKILTSVKVDMKGVRLVVQPSLDLNALSVFCPARVLVFGSDATEGTPFYQKTQADGFELIRADDLNLLDDQRKKNLWTALRQMFGV